MKGILGIGIVVWLCSLQVLASDSLVFAEEEFGQGVFRSRGAECFFVTAGHVVEDTTEVELITTNGSNLQASVVTSFPDDVAILRVDLPGNSGCPDGNWDSGNKLKTLLELETKGIVKTRMDDGSLAQTPVTIKKYNDYRYIQIAPERPEDQFSKGFSGSPLYIAGKLAGMLQSVSNGTGRVFRQDALSHTVALFFKDSQQADTSSQSLGPQTTPPSQPPESGAAHKPMVYQGKLAKDQTIEHTFEGRENSPILVTAKGTTLRYTVQILKGKKKLFEKHTYANNEGTYSFTPPKDGAYIIKLSGFEGYGEYSLSMEQFTTSTALTGKANVMAPGDSVEGLLAKNAYAEYRFEGKENSPLLVTASGTTLRYTLQILKGKKKLFEKNTYANNEGTYSFTPPKDGAYIIKLSGFEGYGEYNLSMASSN